MSPLDEDEQGALDDGVTRRPDGWVGMVGTFAVHVPPKRLDEALDDYTKAVKLPIPPVLKSHFDFMVRDKLATPEEIAAERAKPYEAWTKAFHDKVRQAIATKEKEFDDYIVALKAIARDPAKVLAILDELWADGRTPSVNDLVRRVWNSPRPSTDSMTEIATAFRSAVKKLTTQGHARLDKRTRFDPQKMKSGNSYFGGGGTVKREYFAVLPPVKERWARESHAAVNEAESIEDKHARLLKGEKLYVSAAEAEALQAKPNSDDLAVLSNFSGTAPERAFKVYYRKLARLGGRLHQEPDVEGTKIPPTRKYQLDRALGALVGEYGTKKDFPKGDMVRTAQAIADKVASDSERYYAALTAWEWLAKARQQSIGKAIPPKPDFTDGGW